jgi:hypothetical protein
MTPPSGMIHPLLQRPLEMWESSSTAPKPHLLAHIILPTSTIFAILTWNAHFQRNSIADFQTISVRGRGFSYGEDNTRGFVALG